MYNVVVIILLAFVLQPHAKSSKLSQEPSANHRTEAEDDKVDQPLKAWHTQMQDLDNTTIGMESSTQVCCTHRQLEVCLSNPKIASTRESDAAPLPECGIFQNDSFAFQAHASRGVGDRRLSSRMSSYRRMHGVICRHGKKIVKMLGKWTVVIAGVAALGRFTREMVGPHIRPMCGKLARNAHRLANRALRAGQGVCNYAQTERCSCMNPDRLSCSFWRYMCCSSSGDGVFSPVKKAICRFTQRATCLCFGARYNYCSVWRNTCCSWSEMQTHYEVVSIPNAALMGLAAGSGAAFAALRVHRGTLIAEVPFLG
eukprot:gnl/TRDRNA2_/TRDRNA2_196689_c0_seq1.p1 gnl/TRDRNA2_/TRDRNA2_196689_c0~~gnl/TRDRNA2_/TRDRNA2_196689_c0_seq1.p1  ORF type:complete len:332 (+),score=30.99 gnl/TRDRNA2_/TRDRNA2_196689_c0_seq1:58-996(+)